MNGSQKKRMKTDMNFIGLCLLLYSSQSFRATGNFMCGIFAYLKNSKSYLKENGDIFFVLSQMTEIKNLFVVEIFKVVVYPKSNNVFWGFRGGYYGKKYGTTG